MKILSILISLITLAGLAFAQNVEIKDNADQLLLQVNDEGENKSSITIPSSGTAPGTTANKLYNVSGTLKWSGNPLATGGSSLWLENGSDIYYDGGKVGIGTTTPAVQLHLIGTAGSLFQGTHSSGSIPIEGAGTRFMWYPGKSVLRVGNVTGTHWDDTLVGIYSIAFGYNTVASGLHSFASGNTCEASGEYSISLGNNTYVPGDFAFAVGDQTQATQNYAVAMGKNSYATGEGTVAIGYYTQASAVNSAAFGFKSQASHQGSFVWADNEDAIFTTTDEKQFIIRAAGGVGIGTNAPEEELHVAGEIRLDGAFEDKDGERGTSGQILSSTGTGIDWISSSTVGNTLDMAYDQGSPGAGRTITADTGPVTISGTDGFISTGNHHSGTDMTITGPGTRLMWYPKKSAFRAGYVDGNQWDNTTYLGPYTVAFGYSSRALGSASAAFGMATFAEGNYSTSMGQSTHAKGQNSTAMGYGTHAYGENSTAMGLGTHANGLTSTAMGAFTYASGDYSTAVGYNANAIHQGSFVWADKSEATFISTAVNQFLIRADGGVGINTNNPNEKLEVDGKIRANAGFNFNGTDGVTAGTYNFYNDGTSGNVTQIVVNGGIITNIATAP